MDLYAPYYILADIVCMLFLSLNLYFAFMGVDKQMHKRYLAAATVMAVLYFAADIYWTISEYGTASEVINSNTILYFIMCLMGFSLTLYNLSLQDDDGSMLTGPFIFRLSIPMLINMAAILTTRWTHIYFWVTDKAELVTNPFGYFIMVLFGMGYPLSSCSIALVAALKKENYADRGLYIARAVSFLPAIIAAIMQISAQHMPFVCYGITLSFFILTWSNTISYISLDPLTQINNRAQFRRYLGGKLRDKDDLTLMIMDLNKFKSINDTYGHVEGDRALIRVARALKETCGQNRSKYFISRYGGDEFIVVISGTNADSPEVLAGKIQDRLTQICEEDRTEYALTLSFGYAKRDDTTESIPQLVAAADKKLYEAKHAL